MLRSNSVAFAILLIASGCNRQLAVESAIVCDDFSEGKCKEGAPKNGVYSFQIPVEKTKTWFDFAYHMYFHSRQTPGMRVEFTRDIATGDPLRQSLHCKYKLERGADFVEDHMEGLRWDEDGSGLWCFDYLGTMLVKFHKKFGSIQGKPTVDFFPINLTISLDGGLNTAKSESISLDWQASR
ncbi:MAG: hypothetical protein K8S54_01505 [Spirochaetia bacterium]|nr:hypothetical protein [Spirochaetia bacterium]